METVTEKKRIRRRARRSFTALEKSKAVLSVWAERRSPAEACRELGVSQALLGAWQERALEGMMEALAAGAAHPPAAALNSRLEKLLMKKMEKKSGWDKLQERLDKGRPQSPN